MGLVWLDANWSSLWGNNYCNLIRRLGVRFFELFHIERGSRCGVLFDEMRGSTGLAIFSVCRKFAHKIEIWAKNHLSGPDPDPQIANRDHRTVFYALSNKKITRSIFDPIFERIQATFHIFLLGDPIRSSKNAKLVRPII